MNELDLLKKNWNKIENYPKLTEEKIYGMLHKNSSSTVKWIFIISIIEFAFGILVNAGMNFTDNYKSTLALIKSSGVYPFYQFGSILLWIGAIYFMFRFYSHYKKIAVTESVKKLMESIINTRKTVRSYIIFNLVAGSIFLLTVYSFVLKQILKNISIEQHKELTTGVYIGAFAGVIVVTAIIITLFWLIYRLIYGFLLKRLKKNYHELEKIDY